MFSAVLFNIILHYFLTWNPTESTLGWLTVNFYYYWIKSSHMLLRVDWKRWTIKIADMKTTSQFAGHLQHTVRQNPCMTWLGLRIICPEKTNLTNTKSSTVRLRLCHNTRMHWVTASANALQLRHDSSTSDEDDLPSVTALLQRLGRRHHQL